MDNSKTKTARKKTPNRKVRCNVTIAPDVLLILSRINHNRSAAIDQLAREWDESHPKPDD